MAGNTIGEAWVSIRPDMTGFERDLFIGVNSAIAQVQATVKPISIPVSLDTGALVAQIAGLKAAATAAGGGGGGGSMGIIGGLLWGTGGVAGFASAFSVASLAGFGFEHVLTTGIGLAGSFAGALGGLGVLATGVFGKFAVGMASDMLVMSSTIADTKTFYTALTAIATAQATYGVNSAQAATATQALNVQIQLLGNTAGVQAELGLAKAAQALNSFWDVATSSARVAAVGFIEPFLSVAYTYIPLIATAATTNFTIMTQAFQPFIAWANGPGTAIFKNLETLFAASIPVGVDALTQFVELLAKVANWAAPQTGGVMYSIDQFLTNLNSTAGFTKLEGFMTTLIQMFKDWWALLKQIGITIYDIFHLSVGLGTSIVTILTSMLVKLDAYLTSTSGSAAVHNLFAVHLQEIQAILAILPALIGTFGRLYLMIAPPLTVLVTGLADMVGWMLKIPVVGPIVAWGLAIAILASRMKLMAIGSWIADLGKLAVAFWGVATAAGDAGGLINAIKGVPGLASTAFGGANSAIGQRVFVTNWAMMAGGGAAGAAEGGIGSALIPGAGAAGLTAGATIAGVAAAAIAPLAVAAILLYLNKINPNTLPQGQVGSTTPQGAGTGGPLSGVAKIQNAYAATWAALLASNNAAYKNSDLFQQNLQKDLLAAGIPLAQVPLDATQIANAFAAGKIKTPAQLDAIIAELAHTVTAVAGTAVSAKNMQLITAAGNKIIATSTVGIGSAFSAIGVAISDWGHTLGKAGVSAGVALAAEDAITAFIKVHGPITINEMAAFQFAATATHMTAAGMAQDAATLGKFVKIHGPLTAQQLLLFEDSVTASHGSGAVVASEMNTLSQFVTKHGPLTTQEFSLFQLAITANAGNAAASAVVLNTIAAYIKIHGPLTTQQFDRVQAGITAGANSAVQIGALLISAAAAIGITTGEIRNLLVTGRSVAAGELAKLSQLANTNTGFSRGGIADMPASGGLAMLHGKEMVVPFDKAGWLWPYMASAVASGKPPAFNYAPLPAATTLPGTVMGKVSTAPHIGTMQPVTITQTYHVHGGSPAEMQRVVRQGNRELMLALKAKG